MRADLHPVAHALLSGTAKLLEPDQFAEQAEAAIDLLGLRPYTFVEDELEQALRAVAIQINYTVARGVTGEVLSSKSKGAQGDTFRDDIVSPQAMAIVTRIARAEAWGGGLTSRRGYGA